LLPCPSHLPRPTLFPYPTLFRSRNQRVGIQVVAGALRAVQVGRGIAGDEKHGLGLAVDRRGHPHAAAERLVEAAALARELLLFRDRKSTRLNSSHGSISYAVFCL